MAHSANYIDIVGANAYYDKQHVLKDINLAIEENTITALIGPSGCGKSTFLRMLNRMNDYISSFRMEGRITIGGQDIYSKKIKIEELRQSVGMVFQRPNPFPKSIFENVAYGLRIKGKKNKEEISHAVEDSLRKAALWEEVENKLHKSALSLSGGQQQRLCIARALAVEPIIILMDEPASALDPISTSKIEELINELKQHYTIIIVTHNMQQASRISDYTAFFYMGNLIEYGKTSILFTNPSQKETEDYISGRFG